MPKRPLYKLYFALLLAVPVVLLFVLPADFFDEGQTSCLSVLILGQQCYACGMTRAVQHLIHLDIRAAAELNKLSFVVLPLLIFLYLGELRRVFSLSFRD